MIRAGPMLIVGRGSGTFARVPLYEYACRNCSQRFEELVRNGSTVSCPTCGSADLTWLMSVVSVGRGGDQAPAPGEACGTCGDPRGRGACALDGR